VFLSDQ